MSRRLLAAIPMAATVLVGSFTAPALAGDLFPGKRGTAVIDSAVIYQNDMPQVCPVDGDCPPRSEVLVLTGSARCASDSYVKMRRIDATTVSVRLRVMKGNCRMIRTQSSGKPLPVGVTTILDDRTGQPLNPEIIVTH